MSTTHHEHEHEHEHEHAAASTSARGGHGHAVTGDLDAADVALCPVMAGSPVNKQQAEDAGLVRDHEGQRYWLCCAACGPLFDADPARYAAA